MADHEAVVLNLAQFKQANDQFDHRTGDLVLKAMSNYLHGSGLDERCAVKLAGDKFVIIGPKGGDTAIKEALQTVKIYPARDGVVLTAANPDGTQLALKAERNHPTDPRLEGRIIELGDGFKPPADAKVVVTVANSGENAVRTVATADANGPRAVQDILNDIYGNSPRPAPQATLLGISAEAQAAGQYARNLAEAGRQGLLGRGTISDSIQELVTLTDDRARATAGGSSFMPDFVSNKLRNYRNAENSLARNLSTEELSALNAVARKENETATAAYALDRGTGLVGKERYEFLLERNMGHDAVSGVIVCDVKGFAGINGATRFNNGLGFNRQVGDVGIDAMADALRDGLRRADLPKGMAEQVTLARIGGDEIGLILPSSMNGEQQQKLLKEIDSIRLGLTVDNADHVTVRRLAPGDTLKAGEVDIGVAAGIAGVETARSEANLRTAIANNLKEGKSDQARQLLEQASASHNLPPARLEALHKELEANLNGSGGPLEQPLHHILQAQGDAASEHVKKLEKEFLVLSEAESQTAKAMMQVLQKDAPSPVRLDQAQSLLQEASLTAPARQSLQEIIDDVRKGQLSADQAAFVLGDRTTFSLAHPEMAAQEIKMSRMHTVGYPMEFNSFNRHEIKALPKKIEDHGQERTIFVQAQEYRGRYTGLDGKVVEGTVAVLSGDGKTVLGGAVFELQNQAIAAQTAARRLQEQGRDAARKLAEARQKLALADKLLYQVGESDKYPGQVVRQRIQHGEVVTEILSR